MQERLLAGSGWRETGHVFATRIGTPLDPDNVSHYFKQILREAGLRSQRFHDLRHACATLLLIQGVPARVVQEILGHAYVSTTLGIYSHVIPSLKHDAARQLDTLLAPHSGESEGSTTIVEAEGD